MKEIKNDKYWIKQQDNLEYMRIIFLDIDGVFNCNEFYKEMAERREEWIRTKNFPPEQEADICSERMDMMVSLCDKNHVNIVISSTWRLNRSVKELQNIFPMLPIIGRTPRILIGNKTVNRGYEIQEWLRYNKMESADYIIIDDDSDMLDEQKNVFFKTTFEKGLTQEICDKIDKFFNRLECKS